MAEPGRKLEREFYLRPGLVVAPELIGKRLVHRSPEGTTSGIIVEAEAYIGPEDAAAHSYQGRRTRRTEAMYGPGGYAYLYTIYGLHLCMNVVTAERDRPEAVLIRALQPEEGLEQMRARRGRTALRELCSGPGKLTSAMGIGREYYGADLCGEELYLEVLDRPAPPVAVGRRVNVDYAGVAAEYPWRFVWKDSPFLSVPLREGIK